MKNTMVLGGDKLGSSYLISDSLQYVQYIASKSKFIPGAGDRHVGQSSDVVEYGHPVSMLLSVEHDPPDIIQLEILCVQEVVLYR